MKITQSYLRKMIKEVIKEQRYQKPPAYTPQGDGTTRTDGVPVDPGATRMDAVAPAGGVAPANDPGATRMDAPVSSGKSPQRSQVTTGGTVPKQTLINIQKQLSVLSNEINKVLGVKK